MREVRLDTDRRRTLWRAKRIAKATVVNAWAKRRPLWRGWGEPFNGQHQRARAVRELIERFAPDTLIETGTHFGFTARHLASYGLPLYTVELDPGIRMLARRRLRGRPNVTLVHGDSSRALAWIASSSRIRRPFLYLDAHSPAGLPLESELRTVVDRWADFALLIDDFKVPGDSGYGYWTFEGVPLSIAALSLPEDVIAAFPGAPGASETGSRKGAIYLGRAGGREAISELVSSGVLSSAT